MAVILVTACQQTLIQESPVLENGKDNYLAEYSPDGKKLAYIEDRRTLKIMDVATKEEVTLLTPEDLFHMRDGDQYFTWSPDSKWLLVDWRLSLNNTDVLLMAADGSKRINLNESGYYDSSPKWVNGGKQMLWFSNRNGLKSYATSGRSENDVYSMFFTQEAWDKFNLSDEDFKLMKAIEEAEKKAKEDKEKKEKKDKEKEGDKDKKKKEKKKNGKKKDDKSKDDKKDKKEEDKDKVKPLTFDWDKMKDQRSRLTIHSSRLGDAVLSKDGSKLYYLSRFEGKMNLWSTDLRTKETKMAMKLGANFGSLQWDKDMENLYLLSGGRISKIDPKAGKNKGVKIKGEMEFDSNAEREAINGGPLDKSKMSVKAGMIIEKIDGETVESNQDVAKYLNRKANKFTLLEVSDPTTQKREMITIKPISLGAENQLLYKRWVKQNEKEVHEKSNGTLGYVHIPGMGDGPYRDIYQEMMGKYFDRKGMIVDTRFNGGGDLVADLAMFFTGVPFISYETEAKVVGGGPTFRWTKPTLAMINEAQYSDGHCFACGYSDLKIGKTVGMPTPGTCSFAGWEGLPDGSYWGVVPVSAKDINGNWMENLQTEPDVKVKNEPGVVDNGRDQQLEKAIEEMLKDVRE